MKRNELERAKMVIAMDTIARAVNDESLFMYWLDVGVADGDIDENTTPENLDDYYLDDEAFSSLMGTFVHLIRNASRSGGLFFDGCTDDYSKG